MHGTGAIYQFSLVKGSQNYFVRCSAGDEEASIAQLMQWAEEPELDFDWFDAAVLARQITQRLLCRAVGEEQEANQDVETN
jgi:hypothetical protein